MLMHFAHPCHTFPGEQAGHPVRMQGTVTEFFAKGYGFTLHAELFFPADIGWIGRNNFFHSAYQLIVHPFIRIQIQYPVRIRLRQGEIALGGKIVIPFPEYHPGAVLFGQLHRPVRAAGIHHQYFVRALPGILHGAFYIFFFIFR